MAITPRCTPQLATDFESMGQGFKTPLICSPLPDGKTWRLESDLVWQWNDGTFEVCKSGMETDFASVPDLSLLAGLVAGMFHALGGRFQNLFWLALVIILLAKKIDDDPRTDAPACFHDQDYYERKKKRYVADWHLVVRMRANEVGWWKCFLYWLNLRLFGWFCWYYGSHAQGS